MKLQRIDKFCIFILVMTFMMPSFVFSQQAQPAQPAQPQAQQEKKTDTAKKPHPRDAYDPAERPEENYLARFQAIKIAQKLIRENLENIYMLKVIVSNFKEEGWKKEYEQIYEAYKKGVSLFYRRIVIYSRVELEKNKKAISDLFQKVVNVYNRQCDDMLEKCADKILDFSLDERNKYDPNRNKILFKNMMRLWIAYGQIEDASKSEIDKLFKTSVFHLRIAKAYSIRIMEQLDPVNSKGKFNIHKADNLNRILSPETAKSSSPETTK